jgi:glucokinase
MGHQIIGMQMDDRPPEPIPSFPQPGSLEGLAAGRALDKIAMRVAREHRDSALGRVLASEGAVTGVHAVRAAKEGDPEAVAAVRLLGRRLGVGIANAINIFDPEVVAIGGGVSVAGELLLEPAIEVARRLALPGVGEETEIRLSRYGTSAGVRGAALMAALALGDQVPVT